MKNLWSQCNRPLVVLLIAFALWPFVSAWKQRLTVHAAADSLFAELNHANEQMNAQAKKSGIKTLVQSFVGQFVEGFSAAVDSFGEKQSSKLADFALVSKQVTLSEVRTVPSRFSGQENAIGLIHNGSNVPISGLHLNLTFYAADGHLLDVVDKDLSEIKLLQPGQAVGFTVDHDLGVANADADPGTPADDSLSDADRRKAAAQARQAAAAARKAALAAHAAARVDGQIVSFSVETPRHP